MPEVKTKAKAKTPERNVVYPDYEFLICCHPRDGKEYDGVLTVETAKKLLAWETEPDYEKRMLADDPTLKASKLKFGGEFLLKDKDGNKVRCWNNSTNRPFDEAHARKIAQDVLSKNWEMNGEDIIISRTGLVNSGQHRLIGLVLAGEEWTKQPHWQAVWAEEPYIETVVFLGASDDPKVLRTLDNVKPRSLSDVFYTSPLFANKNQNDRKELSKILDSGVDLLWKRLRATKGGFIEYQTHSASLDFFDRHKKMLACVKHIHDEDANSEDGRCISTTGISTGHAAALLYLMGQSATDPDVADQYYLAGSDKSEKKLDWKYWDKALQFWSDLGANEKDWCHTVRAALAGLNDPDSGRGATARERHSVIALAWAKHILGEKFENDYPEKLHPEFVHNDATNKRRIVDEPTFGGIDRGTTDDDEVEGADPTPEEVEAAKIAERKAREDKMTGAISTGKKPGAAPKPIPATDVKADTDKKVLPKPAKAPPAPPKAPTGKAPTAPVAAPPSAPEANGKKKPVGPPKPPAKPATPPGEPSDAELAAIEAESAKKGRK